MIEQIKNAIVEELIYYKVELDNPDYTPLANTYSPDEEEGEIIKKIFLKPFTRIAETYEFQHSIDIDLNPLYCICNNIFEEASLEGHTKDVLTHLLEVSSHGNIRNGDLFIIRYSGVTVDEADYQAVGIYKVEQKESFLETGAHGRLEFKQGIGANKLDKACLVIDTDAPFTIQLIDNVSKETNFWKKEFVNVGLKQDHVNATNQVISLTKSFITQQIPHEYEVDKTDQIDLLNRSSAYFKMNDQFKKEEFEENVFQDPNMIASFRNFENEQREELEVAPREEFTISKPAVRNSSKVFKSILKLDKNFHIYIHGDKSKIKKGVDESGRKFYQIFYEEER
ncbi:nucleoid-associated protein [Luteibaculum oceani]|uniref:Nucleoid-associated protein n=1 Tax=Luteibaculum oceani TaxID=1294296 RepID=A0A5C6UPL2_9FLAO|nr:nucleoid-associated protein [Luteibaculum oceani]TXC75242.1 nucleoid-associated protein [Luteibaculum oceani]